MHTTFPPKKSQPLLHTLTLSFPLRLSSPSALKMPSITSTSLYFPYPLTTVLPPLLTLTYPPSTLSQTPVTILPNSTLHLPNPGTIRTSLNLVDPVVDEILCIEERGVKWTRGGEKWEMKVEEVGMGGD